jgi:hypothetical protein
VRPQRRLIALGNKIESNGSDVGSSGHRWFFEYRDKTWHPLLDTRGKACSSIRDSAPNVPEALCRELPVPS